MTWVILQATRHSLPLDLLGTGGWQGLRDDPSTHRHSNGQRYMYWTTFLPFDFFIFSVLQPQWLMVKSCWIFIYSKLVNHFIPKSIGNIRCQHQPQSLRTAFRPETGALRYLSEQLLELNLVPEISKGIRTEAQQNWYLKCSKTAGKIRKFQGHRKFLGIPTCSKIALLVK